MAWDNVKATVNDKDWVVSKKSSDSGIEWSFPFASGIEEGGKFISRDKEYIALTATDVAQRGEVVLVQTTGDKYVKSKKRRTEDSSGQENI